MHQQGSGAPRTATRTIGDRRRSQDRVAFIASGRNHLTSEPRFGGAFFCASHLCLPVPECRLVRLCTNLVLAGDQQQRFDNCGSFERHRRSAPTQVHPVASPHPPFRNPCRPNPGRVFAFRFRWMARGVRTGRVAYVIDEWNLPEPIIGGEWAQDLEFNAAEELLRDPDMKFVFKTAIDEGFKLVPRSQD